MKLGDTHNSLADECVHLHPGNTGQVLYSFRARSDRDFLVNDTVQGPKNEKPT